MLKKNFHLQAARGGRLNALVVVGFAGMGRSGSYQILFFLSDDQIKIRSKHPTWRWENNISVLCASSGNETLAWPRREISFFPAFFTATGRCSKRLLLSELRTARGGDGQECRGRHSTPWSPHARSIGWPWRNLPGPALVLSDQNRTPQSGGPWGLILAAEQPSCCAKLLLCGCYTALEEPGSAQPHEGGSIVLRGHGLCPKSLPGPH